MFLFLLGSTLSIPISPILDTSDIDNDGILDEDEFAEPRRLFWRY